MGARNIRSLLDVSIAGQNLKISCEFCGHWRIVDPGRLMWTFQRRNWNQSLETVPLHLRCLECGHKRIELRMTGAELGEGHPHRSTRSQVRMVRSRDAPPCPSGIDADAWATATERERRKMVERSRS